VGLSIVGLIILSFWIYALQNRVSDLEKIVKNSKNSLVKKPISSKQEVSFIEKTTSKQEWPVTPREETLKIFGKLPKEQNQKSKEPSKVVQFLTNYFTTGNLLVRIGSVVLFFGLAFLAKYAAEHSVISIEIRLLFIAMLAIVLVALGWRLKNREGAYGEVLQGLGIAMFYLVIYVASKFYALLSFDIAFVLMLIVVVIGSILAVIQNALPLAIFSIVGGFLVPILTASDSGSHVVLFSYYALLNFGIFIQAWYRSWRLLNVVGFIFTFVIATAWGVLQYEPDLFVTTEPFLILFFMMYLTISILFTLKHSFELKNFIDGTLVFGLPMVVFPLQVNLVQHFQYAEALSAIILGVLYITLSQVFKNNKKTDFLAQVFLLLGVIFFTISIPYIFDADLSAALWSMEGCVAVWIALRQKRVYSRYLAEILLLVSAFIYPYSVQRYGFTSFEYLGYIIVIVSVFMASYFLNKNKKQLSDLDMHIDIVFLGISTVLWFFSTPIELIKFNISYSNSLLFSLFIVGCMFYLAVKYLNYNLLIKVLQFYLPIGVVLFYMNIFQTFHPFEGFGFIIIGSFFMFNYFLLYQYDKTWEYVKQMHILSIWFVATVLIFEVMHFARVLHVSNSMLIISMAIVPLVFSVVLLTFKQYGIWLEKYREDYWFTATGGFVFTLILWELKAFSMPPDFDIFIYIPLLNPIDIMQSLVLFIFSLWIYRNKNILLYNNKIFLYNLLALMSVIFFTVVFARSIYVYRSVSYDIASLWSDIYFQTGLSILWSIIAIIAMFISKKYDNRPAWLAGFGLLVVVVLKLFFVELASSGTIERIVSFIIVGSLLLLIGYFVPLPPSKDVVSKKEKKNEF